jgi:hypothetical protein
MSSLASTSAVPTRAVLIMAFGHQTVRLRRFELESIFVLRDP